MDSNPIKKVNWFILVSSISTTNTSATRKGVLKVDHEILETHKANPLNGIDYDCARLTTDLKNNDRFSNYKLQGEIKLSSGMITTTLKKKHIMLSLQTFFDLNTSQSSLLIYSGHGGLDNNKAYLVLECKDDKNQPKDERLYYKEIREMWNSRKSKENNKFLLMIIDACHSGGWVEENNNNVDFKDIFIQASCLNYQSSLDIQGKGGVLLNNFLEKNLEKNFEIYPTDKHTPCYSGFYFKIKEYFNIDLMFDSWNDFRKNNKVNKDFGNGVRYEGDCQDGKKHGKGICYLF